MMLQQVDRLFDVSDKVVAITGAAGVLFGAVANGLAERGAKVALLDLAGEKARQSASEIEAKGGSALGIECNVVEQASVAAALERILHTYGRVDVLINGAGGNTPGGTVQRDQVFGDLSVKELEEVFALNSLGTIIPAKIFCQQFAKQRAGLIVNTASVTSLCPLTNIPGYSAGKAAVTNFTRWLAVQVRVDYPEAEIRVNEIAPGFFHTTQNHRLLFEDDDITLTPRGQAAIEHTPLGRFGSPEELLGPILLLISPAGKFLNGLTIVVDGGFTIYAGVGPLDEKPP